MAIPFSIIPSCFLNSLILIVFYAKVVIFFNKQQWFDYIFVFLQKINKCFQYLRDYDKTFFNVGTCSINSKCIFFYKCIITFNFTNGFECILYQYWWIYKFLFIMEIWYFGKVWSFVSVYSIYSVCNFIYTIYDSLYHKFYLYKEIV